jgi:hypothetical protein
MEKRRENNCLERERERKVDEKPKQMEKRRENNCLARKRRRDKKSGAKGGARGRAGRGKKEGGDACEICCRLLGNL